MGDKTAIEWTDASWNPIRARLTEKGRARAVAEGRKSFAARDDDGNYKMRGIGFHCEHVTEACRFCYAERNNIRLGTGLPFKPAHLDNGEVEIFLDERTLMAPLRWRRPRKIFLTSMTDVAAHFVTDDMLDRLFAVMALTPEHTYQVLTKRPERMRDYLHGMEDCYHGNGNLFARRWGAAAADVASSPCAASTIEEQDFPLPNVWIGTSVHDQASADEFLPHLRDTPAAKRFISYEPALGPLLLAGHIAHLDWVIAGGESGQHARPAHPDWFRSISNICHTAGVPFFFKQWGEWIDAEHLRPYESGQMPALNFEQAARLANGRVCQHQSDGTTMIRVGKKPAGRMLDGREHSEIPSEGLTP